MKHLRRLLFLSAVVVVLLATAPGRAGYVTAELNGTNIDNIINPGVNVTINLGDGSAPSINYKPGVVNWTLVATDSAIPHNFTTFCLELTQDISPGNQYTYSLTALEDAPKPGSGPTGGNNGMGLTKANEIRDLWGAFHSSIGTDGVKAAAFQLDIWKIEYDWGDASATDFGSGNFQANGNAAATSQATTWLMALSNAQNNFTMANDLIAMTNPNAQDQLTELVPVPPTFALAGAGLLSLLGYGSVRRLGKSPRTAAAV